MARGDNSERGFNVAGNTRLVPVRCPVCTMVTRVFSRNVSWLCPFCGRAYADGVDKYTVGKDDLRRQLTIQERFSLGGLQKALWADPSDYSVGQTSKEIILNLKRGRY